MGGDKREGVISLTIVCITPSVFFSTSLFQNLSTLYPFFCSHSSRISSLLLCKCSPPSISMASFFSKQTKSTMYFPIGCCLRNFTPNCLLLTLYYILFSASVIFLLSLFARILFLGFSFICVSDCLIPPSFYPPPQGGRNWR